MKLFKKVLCILLSLSLLIGGLVLFSHAAGSAKACNCGSIPRVTLPGIGDALYMNFGTSEQSEVGVVNTDGLTEQILPIIKNVISAAATRSWDKGADALSALANGMFAHLQVDEYGKSVMPISNPPVFNKDQDHRESPSYKFRYDWRLDPMEIAVELNEFIKQVMASTGHKKVILTSHSEGGLICMAYFAQFGHSAIEHFIPEFSAHNGLNMIGELFTGNVQLDAAQLTAYLRAFGGTSDGGFQAILAPLSDMLDVSGLARPLISAVGLLLENVQDKVFADTLIPLFGQWPALWGFVPDEYYEDAKVFMLSDPKYADFIKLIDNFHYKAGPGTADKIIARVNKATKVSIIAAYGFPPIPVVAQFYDTDALIDTARASSGATTAGYGKTFPENYKQKVAGHDHISPDRRIDASTCLLPDQTWFIKDHPHFSFEHHELLDFLASSKKQPTVFTDKNFPQFTTRLPDKTFVPTVAQAPAAEVTLLTSARELLSGGWKLIVDSIRG
ncbi:MAG: hypothetical protein FWF05_03445 [Oscillospiraceae bacterium]|nr:hypothetical protein [Oscillospiraceae bacterium]